MSILERIKNLRIELDELLEKGTDHKRILQLSEELDILIEDFMLTRKV